MYPALAAEVGGRIADGLNAQCSPFLEVLLDARVLIEDVDDDVHAARNDLGRERAIGVRADLTTEGQLHLVRPTDVEVVGNECLEEAAGAPRCVKHQGARGFNLEHRELPQVAGLLIGGIQGCGYAGHPAIEEGLQVSRAKPITNCLQAVGVDTRCEPIGQFGKCESLSLSSSFSPLVGVGSGRGTHLSVGSVSPTRSAEPDVRVTTHPALRRFRSLGWMTIIPCSSRE